MKAVCMGIPFSVKMSPPAEIELGTARSASQDGSC